MKSFPHEVKNRHAAAGPQQTGPGPGRFPVPEAEAGLEPKPCVLAISTCLRSKKSNLRLTDAGRSPNSVYEETEAWGVSERGKGGSDVNGRRACLWVQMTLIQCR